MMTCASSDNANIYGLSQDPSQDLNNDPNFLLSQDPSQDLNNDPSFLPSQRLLKLVDCRGDRYHLCDPNRCYMNATAALYHPFPVFYTSSPPMSHPL